MPSQKSNNPERETRILDAASRLIVHYGYDKTTVSDIAREAGISKGAIYLHFKSKDALFEALLSRALMQYTTRWLDLLDADERGGTIGAMYKNSLVALNESPFMAAMFRQDSRVLGSYVRKQDGLFKQQQEQDTRLIFVQMMQDAGAIRKDMDSAVIAHIMDMLAYGLVSMDDVKPAGRIPPLDDLFTGIAELLDSALTPEDSNPDAGKAVIRQIADAARQQFETTSLTNSKTDT